MKAKLQQPLTIEISEPGWLAKYSMWMREKLGSVDKMATPIARAIGSNKIKLFEPGFFEDNTAYQTLVHEAAHLMGIGGDIYFMEKGLEKMKSTEQA